MSHISTYPGRCLECGFFHRPEEPHATVDEITPEEILDSFGPDRIRAAAGLIVHAEPVKVTALICPVCGEKVDVATLGMALDKDPGMALTPESRAVMSALQALWAANFGARSDCGHTHPRTFEHVGEKPCTCQFDGHSMLGLPDPPCPRHGARA